MGFRALGLARDGLNTRQVDNIEQIRNAKVPPAQSFSIAEGVCGIHPFIRSFIHSFFFDRYSDEGIALFLQSNILMLSRCRDDARREGAASSLLSMTKIPPGSLDPHQQS